MKMIKTAGDWLAFGQHLVPFFFNCWFQGHNSLRAQLYAGSHFDLLLIVQGRNNPFRSLRLFLPYKKALLCHCLTEGPSFCFDLKFQFTKISKFFVILCYCVESSTTYSSSITASPFRSTPK